jgi:hypothetical protein
VCLQLLPEDSHAVGTSIDAHAICDVIVCVDQHCYHRLVVVGGGHMVQ